MDFKSLKEQLLKFWNNLDKKQRIIYTSSAVGAIILFSLIIGISSMTEYTQLVQLKDPADAGPIIEKLKERRIPYKFENDGHTILVPIDNLHETRLDLASSGVTRNISQGFELFDKQQLGAGAFVQQINYHRALEGEIARTISSINGVDGVRVHLSIPKRRLFTRDQRKPSASIMLKLTPSKILTNQEILGIRHLVSSAIEGMEAGAVTIIDGEGKIVARPFEGKFDLATNQLELKRRMEHELDQRIVEIIEPLVGLGKVVARSDIDVDFSKRVETAELYDPDNQVVRTSQLTEQSSQNSKGGNEGVAGARGNTPNQQKNTQKRSNSNTRKENLTYDIDKRIITHEKATGELKRISLSVVVDGVWQNIEGKEEPQFQARSDKEMQSLQAIIARAVGFNEKRGDTLEVKCLPFTGREEIKVSQASFFSSIPWSSLIRYFSLMLIALLLIFVVFKPMLATFQTTIGNRPALAGNTALHQAITPGKTVAEIQQELALPPKMPIQNESFSTMREKAISISKDEPEKAARIVRSWINSSL